MTQLTASATTPNDPPAIEQLIDRAPFSFTQLLVLVICSGLNMLDGFDVLAMSFSASSVAGEWGLPAHQLGAVFSAALFGMMMGAMFIAPLADRVGRRPVVLASVMIISVGMIATGFVENLWQLVILRGITGLGIGSMLASLTSLVSEYMPRRHRNFCVGILQASYPLGAVLGGFFAAPMIPEFGWRSVFIGGGLMSVAAFFICLLWLPESLQMLARLKADSPEPDNSVERDNSSPERDNKALERINRILGKMNINAIAQLPESKQAVARASVASLLNGERRMMTLSLWMAFLLSFSTLYFLISWVPKLLFDAGLPLDRSIYAGAALNLGGALGVIVLGRISSFWSITRLIMLFLLSGAVAMVLFAWLDLSISFLLALTAIIGFFVFGGFVSLYSVAARIYPAEVRTTGVGWAIGMGRMGAVIGPFAAGIMISMGFSTGTNFIVFSIPLVIAAAFTIRIRSPELLAGRPLEKAR